MVGTTLVISAAVIAILGFFLTEQINQGLVLNAESSARTQMLAGLNTARGRPRLTTKPTSGPAAWEFMTNLAGAAAEQQRPTRYYLAVGLNTALARTAGYPPWATTSEERVGATGAPQ